MLAWPGVTGQKHGLLGPRPAPASAFPLAHPSSRSLLCIRTRLISVLIYDSILFPSLEREVLEVQTGSPLLLVVSRVMAPSSVQV